jgi:hypothetical protein
MEEDLFVVLIGQALFPSFSFSFPAIYHHCFILISPFVVLSSSIVGIPDLLQQIVLYLHLIEKKEAVDSDIKRA